MSKLHRELWKNINRYLDSHYYYAPEYWMPHITLAIKDVDPEKLACAVSVLAGEPLDFNITLTSMAILYDYQGETGIKSIYKFYGTANNNRI